MIITLITAHGQIEQEIDIALLGVIANGGDFGRHGESVVLVGSQDFYFSAPIDDLVDLADTFAAEARTAQRRLRS